MKQIKSGILLIAVGSVIYGCAVGLLLNPNGIVTGGVSGLAVILGRFVPLGVGTLTVLLNIPLLILGRAYFGRRFFGLTLLSILLSGGAADFTSRLTPLTQQPLPCAVAGGIFIGVGCGLVFRGGATTGGVDIAAKVLRQKKPHIRTGHAFLLIDGFICVLSGIFSHSFDNAVYSFFALGTFSKTLDFVLYGSDEAKSALIISRQSERIKDELLHGADVGCTVLYGERGYTGERASVLLCAVTRRQLPETVSRVLALDPTAFMLVGSVSQIYGKGFKEDNSDYF